MTERLIEAYPCDSCNVQLCYRQCYKMTRWAEKSKEKLAEYETADEERRLVVLPCDTVYFICDKGTKDAHVRTKSILDLLVYDINGIDKDGRYWSVKEEAEKALKEMEGNHE